MKLIDTWFGGESENNGKAVIIRGRQHLRNFIESKQYNTCVEIEWSFETKTENGIPLPEENQLMGKVEDSLIDHLENDLQSILTIVYTKDNIRTWIFYTKSISNFIELINKSLSSFRRFPISITHDEDENWELYASILKGFNLKPK